MAKSAKTVKPTKTKFLPEWIWMFLKNSANRLVGVMILAVTLGLFSSLISYNPNDPSFNMVTDALPQNNLGAFGSYTADLIWQILGIGGYGFVLIGLGWAWRFITTLGIKRKSIRFLSGLIGISLLSALLGIIETITGPLSNNHLGGMIGFAVVNFSWNLQSFVLGLGDTVPSLKGLPLDHLFIWGLCLIFLGLSSSTLLFAMALRKSEWLNMQKLTMALFKLLLKIIGLGVPYLISGFQQQKSYVMGKYRGEVRLHHNDHNSDDDETEPSLYSSQSQYKHTKNQSHIHKNDSDDDGQGEGQDDSVVPLMDPDLPLEDQDGLQSKILNQDVKDHDNALSTSGVSRVQSRKDLDPVAGKKSSTSSVINQQAAFNLDLNYQLPTLDLLERPLPRPSLGPDFEDSLEQNARQLELVLQDFGVKGKIIEVCPGPVVTLYALQPAPGIKSSRVVGLADDVARSMSALSVRIATIPGRNVIGIELPNAIREMVPLYELLDSKDFTKTKAILPLILGKDISGAPQVVDLATMPHLLIAGTTGSGKSVGLNAMILSLLYRHSPEQCRFIMIDPKMLELSVYNDIPHLLTPVVTDPKKAVVALKWSVREMEDRYRAISRMGGVRNIDAYNKKVREAIAKGEQIVRKIPTGIDPDSGQPIFEEQPLELKPLPYLVVVVDEMADLMLVAGKEIEASIQRLAQMARAAGIHIIMATQRPSVDVITGTIKANFPTRISFAVTSKIDARTVMGEQGAEQLLGKGDMLVKGAGGRITRVHGPFVEDSEVERVCNFIRSQGQPDYLNSITDETELGDSISFGTSNSDGNPQDIMGENGEVNLYDQAVAFVSTEGRCSTSLIQRQFRIGYNRAADIVDRMEKEGVISSPNHSGKREVLVGDHSS